MSVTLDHLTKHLKKRLQEGDYGSVLITIQDGKVISVNDQNSFNAASFVEHVEKPVKLYVKKNKRDSDIPEKDKNEQEQDNCNNVDEKELTTDEESENNIEK